MASHLTFQEREILYRMKRAKKPFSEIAEALGRDRRTIYREVNRNSGGRGYRPQQAQRFADERREVYEKVDDQGAFQNCYRHEECDEHDKNEDHVHTAICKFDAQCRPVM